MEIIVKPRNINHLNKYINEGANAFLFGIKDFSINQTSFLNTKTLLFLKKKYNRVKLYVAINKNIFNKDIDRLKKILIEIDNIKIDGIFFYDLSLINICSDLKIKTPLVWNQNYFVTNYETCNYYLNNGVNKGVISSEITLNEIKKLVTNTKMELFINSFGYQMMSFSKRNLITDYFKHIKAFDFKKYHYIISNNIKYLVIENKFGTMFLSPYVLNTIKEINSFKAIGINGLILDELMINHKEFLKVINCFSNSVNKKISNDALNNYYNEINNIIGNTSEGFLYNPTIYSVKRNKDNEK